MDTNIRLAILVLIFLFGGSVWAETLLLRRRRAQVEAMRFREHEARPRVANFHQATPVILRRQK
jgi:CBS domain containing-hemolysin-like protein